MLLSGFEGPGVIDVPGPGLDPVLVVAAVVVAALLVVLRTVARRRSG